MSPCIQVCRLDAQKVCIGCGRTVGEVMEWSRATHARKRDIVAAAKKRMLQAS